MRSWLCVLLWLPLWQNQATVEITVLDQARQPLPGIHIRLKIGDEEVASADTGSTGQAVFSGLRPARYEIAATREGLEPAHARELDLGATASTSIELTMVPVLAHREEVEVRGTADAVEAGAAAPASLEARTAKELPDRPATVADALPMIPGVVREPGGALVISASPENRSALIVNSADVTDPATGQFGLTVPIDSVEELNVYQTPYLAEYGRFTAALVSVETRRGGDKWKWELNDPLPEFRIRSYHLRGLKDATPRLNFEGPLIPGKLFFSEGFEYEVRRTAVYTLPFPHNQKRKEGINSFAQLDWVASARQLVTATIHIAPQRLGFANIDYFNPEPTSPDAGTHNYTGTLADHITILGGVLEVRFSETRFDARVWAQGPDDLVITPTGNRGNYFAQQDRTAGRTGGAVTYAFVPFARFGKHELKAGAAFTGSSEQGDVNEHPVDILDAAGGEIERIVFPHNRSFDITDSEAVLFVQDHWTLSDRLAVDLGVRGETQQVAGTERFAPRAGIVWRPFAGAETAVRAGGGLFYDRVPLNVYCFNRYPNRVITTYDDEGQILTGPVLYLNTLGQVRVRFPFVSQKPIDGNFSPRSSIWSMQLEQPVSRRLLLRTGYVQNNAAGLVTLDSVPPDPTTNLEAYLLGGAGQSHYRQFEITARVRGGKDRELFVSYVRSRARGDLNEFGSFLGTFPSPIIRDNRVGRLPADLPDRLLAWGLVRLPRRFAIAPVVEYRSGFPYSAIDGAQGYFGEPNGRRFPSPVSIDARVSKDISVTAKYAVRLSVSGFNLLNHFNPEAVHNNIADPAWGRFFGHRGRRFTADFDVLF